MRAALNRFDTNLTPTSEKKQSRHRPSLLSRSGLRKHPLCPFSATSSQHLSPHASSYRTPGRVAWGRAGGLGLHQSPEIGRIHPQVRQRPQCIIPPDCSKHSRASFSPSPMSITAWRTTAAARSTHGPESRHAITSTHTTAPCVAYAHAAPGSTHPGRRRRWHRPSCLTRPG